MLDVLKSWCNRVTDYEAQNTTVTVTVPTQGSIPVNSIFGWMIWMTREMASGFNWNLTWVNYKNGFGWSDSTDYWMGLERLHLMTTSGKYRLRMEWQQSPTDMWFSIEYWFFYVDNEASKYMLHVDGYILGDDGRALYVHRLIKYSLDNLRPIRTAEAFEAVNWLHQQTWLHCGIA